MMFQREKIGLVRDVRWLSLVFLFGILLIVVRLFFLQVLNYSYYSTLALSTHEIYQKIHPERGQIFFQDSRDGATYPVAVNRRYFQVYAVPNEIKPEEVESIAKSLNQALALPAGEIDEVKSKIGKGNDPYEALAKKIPAEAVENLKTMNLKGIYWTPEVYRYYPEENWAAAILGFCSFDANGNLEGHYGVEGYWNKILAGKSGFLLGERGAGGGLISLAGVTSVEAENGANVVLTIDRALQYQACSRLRAAFEEYKARSASLVMVDPKTGAILAMCSEPDFDPNNYSQVDDFSVYNNRAIFTPYEPGSVFKPLVMSAALDMDLVGPQTTFDDPCARKFGQYTIHNALNKCYGRSTMTQVLENSINTGMIWVEERMPKGSLREYIEKFGFGQKTGAPLDTEMAGNISLLKKDADIFNAQASFGQGITVTPMQLAMAYAALANQGMLLEPFLVKETQYPDGRRERQEAKEVRRVVSPQASKLITAMLVSTVENTYFRTVRLDDYYIAGKTGTAQIPGKGGYTDETNHTFGGFAPATDPRFVMVVRFEAPQRQWAESTAAVVFKDVAKFALDYYGIKGDK